MFKRRRDAGDDTLATAVPLPAPVPLSGPRHIDSPAKPADNGLDVPPFRSALSEKAPPMARSPFNSPPPNQPPAGSQGLPQRPPLPPGAQPGGPMPVPAGQVTGQPGASSAVPQQGRAQERRTLVVGRGISLQGVIQDAERLVVEGTVEAQLLHANELAVAPGGIFKGEVEVEDAEIAGTIDGAVTARSSLVIRGSGRVIGTARCRRLQVEDGGQISGKMEMITEAPGSRGPGGPDRAA